MTRRLIIIAALAAGAVLAVIVTLPWWWGAALRRVGEDRGLEFGTYERIGYARWALSDVVWSTDRVAVRIERLEAPHPLHWAVTGGEAGPLVGGAWEVEIGSPGEDEAPPAAESGWSAVRAQVAEIHGILEKWLPEATLGEGQVRWPDRSLRVDAVQWTGRRLNVQGLAYAEIAADVVLTWPETGTGPVIEAKGTDATWRLLATPKDDGLQGDLEWHGQPARFSATFPRTGWVPEQASLAAAEWRLPGDVLKLGDYYAEVRADLAVEWTGDEGAVHLEALGDPRPGQPALRVRVMAEGDPSRITIRELDVQAPGLEAVLEEAVTLDPWSRSAETTARFRLEADLAALPQSPGAGRVTGEVRVEPRKDAWPGLRGRLRFDDVVIQEWADGVQADVEAMLEWPRLTVASAAVADVAGSDLSARGSVDLEAKIVEQAELAGRIAAASIARWLPEAVAFEQAEVEGSATGSITALQHQGRVQSGRVTLDGLHPMAVGAGWTGQGDAFEVRVAAETTNGFLRMVARRQKRGFVVEELQVLHQGEEAFALAEPVHVQPPPDLRIERLRLSGPLLELAAELDAEEKRVAVEAPRVSLEWVNDWWTGALPVQTARLVQLQGELVEGTVRLEASGEMDLVEAGGREVTVRVDLSADEAGLRIRELTATAGGELLVRAGGRLPVSIRPADSPVWSIEENGPLALDARVEPAPGLWEELARHTGIQLENPRLQAELAGTWKAPRGMAHLTVPRIERRAESDDGTMPVVTALDVMLRGDGEGLVLENLSAEVEGQPLRASGRVPLTRAEWDTLRDSPLDYLREHAMGQLVLPRAELAAFSRVIPAFLAPVGHVQAELEFGAGGRIGGSLRLRGAASRPLGPLGVLQDITADLSFEGRAIEVSRLQAHIGGQPVTLSGRALLPDSGPPRLDLRLRGRNLPLVRQVGVLLRADLDLALATDEAGEGRVTGDVRLRDGLFLADLQDIVPRGGGGNRSSARPPYFTVPITPLNRWELDVTVEGDRFLRLRTPVLQGVASARFQLGGTLGDPRALGDAVVEEGRVRLPFATFRIEEGTVSLTQADPYQPQLSLLGTTRRLGYDLRMEVTGTASDPRLQFFSSPPLPSEDILLLVMAGQAPQEEVTYSGGQRAVQLGAFLGRGVIGDVFGGGDDPKLTVTTGERVSRQGRETYRFSYELTPRLSLVGEYDEFDSYNSGLRWRLLPRSTGPENGDEDEASEP